MTEMISVMRSGQCVEIFANVASDDRVVLDEPRQDLVVGRESERDLVEDGRVQVLLAGGKKHPLRQLLQGVPCRLRDPWVGVGGELHEQQHEVAALDRDHPPSGHHPCGGWAVGIGKAPEPFRHGVDRYR